MDSASHAKACNAIYKMMRERIADEAVLRFPFLKRKSKRKYKRRLLLGYAIPIRDLSIAESLHQAIIDLVASGYDVFYNRSSETFIIAPRGRLLPDWDKVN